MFSCFLTGAGGFVAGHLAEVLVERGCTISALSRPGSDASRLEALGVQVHRGELSDVGLLRRLAADAEVVIHAAAKIDTWGSLEEFRRVNVEGTRAVLAACKGQALARFVYLNCLDVYKPGHHFGADETAPLPRRHKDNYCQSKLEAEKLAFHYYQEFGIPVVSLRLGYVYGPRERRLIPGIIDGLRQEKIRYVGTGQQALSTLFIGNLLQAVMRAIEIREAVGQVYNIADGEYVSKRQFIEQIADFLELPFPSRSMPLWLARLRTRWDETMSRLTGSRKVPAYTQSWLRFFAYNQDFSIAKAQRELDYHPRWSFEDGMYQTLKWFKENFVQQEAVSQT